MQPERIESQLDTLSEAEKVAVLRQLDRLLLDPSFKNSKRYPSFLRFVVSRALEGNSGSLKERILGIEVFGRSPDYDSTQDPIVRVTAAEIRKRLVRYYEDPSHEKELRLFLPSGSYVPRFELLPPENIINETSLPESLALAATVDAPATVTPAGESPIVENLIQSAAPLVASTSHSRGLWGALGFAALVALVLGATHLYHARQQRPTVESFWAPVTNSQRPVLFCIADQSVYGTGTTQGDVEPASLTKLSRLPTLVTMEDTIPLVDFVSVMRRRESTFHMQTQEKTTFSDLAHGPNILIGAFDNKWTLFVTRPLRFHFENDPGTKQLWIEDRQNPSKRDWLLIDDAPRSDIPRKDYALVARFVDPNTNQIMVVVAGLGHNGTSAAGSFLVSAQSLSELDKSFPRMVNNSNLEVVLEVMVVNGHPGPPHIDAAYSW
jgi:hypothetical protein